MEEFAALSSREAAPRAREEELRSLMVRYQAGEAAAVEELVKRVSPSLEAFFRAGAVPPHDAEDLLQDCWLRIHRARHTYRASEPLLPWIFAIARHTRVDGFRRLSRRARRELSVDGVPELAGPPPGNSDVMGLLDRLPESQREVLWLLKVSGMSVQEVARATASTVGAVKQKAHALMARCGIGWAKGACRMHSVDPPPQDYRRIARLLAESLEPVKPLPPSPATAGRLLAGLAVAAVILTALLGTAGLERMTLIQIVILSVVLTTGAFLLSASLSWQMRPGSYHRLPAAAVIAAFGIGMLAGISLFFPWRTGPEFLAQGWPCLMGGAAMAAAAAVLLWLVVRRGVPLSIPKLGATLGATAGLLGLAVLQIKCPLQDAPHLLVFHGGALALSTFAGWAIGLAVTVGGRRAKYLARRVP